MDKIIHFDFSRSGRLRLYRVVINIAAMPGQKLTAPGDPELLCLWVFAESTNDASRRAGRIAKEFPFEITENVVTVFDLEKSPDTEPDLLIHEKIARDTGFSFVVIAVRADSK